MLATLRLVTPKKMHFRSSRRRNSAKKAIAARWQEIAVRALIGRGTAGGNDLLREWFSSNIVTIPTAGSGFFNYSGRCGYQAIRSAGSESHSFAINGWQYLSIS